MRKAGVALALLCAAAPARAQTAYERVSLDTTVAIDFFHGVSPAPLFAPEDNISHRPQVIIDIVGTAQLGKGWQIFVRPWFRLARPSTATATPPPWDAQIYQASLRYEHAGPVSTRVDVGYMPSPIGLGIFDVNPRQNPTIAGHASYFTPMLPFDTGSARVPAIASTYPLAGVVTVSANHWDARAALTNSSPVRISIVGVTANPRATPVFEGGAGVTPTTGLRFGVSFAHGAYLTSEEFAPSVTAGGRTLTLVGFESEYSFRYTKISGEVIHDTFTVPAGSVGATEWFVQATQTLTARWFVAGRHEGTSAPVVGLGAIPFGAQPRILANELTGGFRINRDFLVKASYYVRQSYGRLDWDQQVAVQAVFQHRWW
jgi:hypothetical protein